MKVSKFSEILSFQSYNTMLHLKNLHFVLVCGRELPQYVLQNLRWIMQKVCTCYRSQHFLGNSIFKLVYFFTPGQFVSN